MKSVFAELFSDDEVQLSERQQLQLQKPPKQRPEQVAVELSSAENLKPILDAPARRKKEIVVVEPTLDPNDEVGQVIPIPT